MPALMELLLRRHIAMVGGAVSFLFIMVLQWYLLLLDFHWVEWPVVGKAICAAERGLQTEDVGVVSRGWHYFDWYMCVWSMRLLSISHAFVTDLRRLLSWHVSKCFRDEPLRWLVVLGCFIFVHHGFAMILVVGFLLSWILQMEDGVIMPYRWRCCDWCECVISALARYISMHL